MASAKVISLVDVRLREEMIMRDVVLDGLAAELVHLRDLVDALRRDIDQLKQGGVSHPE
jgi:hypothetical protein